MNQGIFLIIAFALLLAHQKFEAPKYWPIKTGFYLFFDEALEIGLQIGALLVIYALLLQFLIPSGSAQDLIVLFSLLGAYLFKQLRKTGDIIFLTVFTFVYWIQWRQAQLPLWEQIWMLVRMMIGLAGFQILIAGLQERLLLADVPRLLKGVPIFLLSACLLALAFGEVWVFLP